MFGSSLDWWISELVAMNIKWVKVLDDGSGSAKNVCQNLLARDIIPIVRVYRGRPNPGTLSDHDKTTMSQLVAMGVRYFEVNNEPNLEVEWQPGGNANYAMQGVRYQVDLATGNVAALSWL